MKFTEGSLEDQLSFFNLHLSRLKCHSQLVMGLIHLRTVNLAPLSLVFSGKASSNSSYRRIQRFLANVAFPFDALSRFIWGHFQGEKPAVLALDRTNLEIWQGQHQYFDAQYLLRWVCRSSDVESFVKLKDPTAQTRQFLSEGTN